MNILAIDTSTDILSAAIKTDSSFYAVTAEEKLKHSEKLIPIIERLSDTAGISINSLDLVICSRGPGSFTGLRIGIATAKGICFALSIPLITVPTLDFTAYRFSFFDGCVIPVIDAKKNRFYTALYVNGERKTDYLDAEIEDIAELTEISGINTSGNDKILLTGKDADKLYNALVENDKNRISSRLILDPVFKGCRIQECMNIGIDQFSKSRFDSENTGPLYIRKSDAEEKLAAE